MKTSITWITPHPRGWGAFDDALMVKITANENMSDWHMDTAVMNQTIWAVQDFIRDEILAGRNPMPRKVNQKRISEIKLGSPVGSTLLKDFLGDSWETRIRTALELLSRVGSFLFLPMTGGRPAPVAVNSLKTRFRKVPGFLLFLPILYPSLYPEKNSPKKDTAKTL